MGDLNFYLVPLAAYSFALRLVANRVKSAKIRSDLTIKLRHVLQSIDLVQTPAGAIGE